MHAWSCKPSQPPMAGQITGPKREPTSATFLKQYNFLLYSKYLRFCPQISVTLSPYQRSLLVQWIETITGSITEQNAEDRGHGGSTPRDTSAVQLLSTGSGRTVEDGSKRSWKPEDQDVCYYILDSVLETWQGKHTHKISTAGYTVTAPASTPAWQRNSTRFHPRLKSYRWPVAPRVGQSVSFGEKLPSEVIHSHVYIYVYIHTHTYTCINIS